MSGQDWVSLLQSWNVTPVVAMGLLLVAMVYSRGWWVYRRRGSARFPLHRLTCFLAGLVTVFVALQSPLDVAAAFSLQVHMVQHLLLMIVAPPLLLYGTPTLPMIAGLPRSFREDWLTPFSTWKPLRRSLGFFLRPAVAGVLFAVMLWVWHAPQLYELALQSGGWHRVEHACFLTASILFWWPVFEPYPFRAKRSRWILVPYLFLAGIQGSALAAILAFSPREIYSYYKTSPNIFGIDSLTDQSLAGAIMWVPMAVSFLIGIVYVSGEQFSATTQTSHRINRNPFASGSLTLKSRESDQQPRANARWLISATWWLNQLARKPIRRTLQFTMLLLSVLVVVDGVSGPQVAAINLARVLPWIHWRGFLVIALVLGGNFFCMVCPFTILRSTAKRLFKPVRRWPKSLQNKWLAIAMLILFFWSYEPFALWERPLATALIVIGYFAAVFVIDALFVEAPFCKFVCPIGQFNFVHSLVSPARVAIADGGVCSHCTTKDCIAGNENSPGCQTQLFQPKKQGNMDCTFCMDCVAACPHENVAVFSIGLCASFVVAYHIGGHRTDEGLMRRQTRDANINTDPISGEFGYTSEKQQAAVIPWLGLMIAFYAACVWVLLQPMQMRGAAMVGM